VGSCPGLSTKQLTVSQLQDNNAKLKDKIDLIDMRLEEQEQYSRRTSLRFHNVRVPTDQKGNSRTVGSAKKFVRITSGVGGGEFTKKLRKVCTCQKLKFSYLLLEYCKIRECYAVVCNFVKNNLEM
jgi:hypothetical protein